MGKPITVDRLRRYIASHFGRLLFIFVFLIPTVASIAFWGLIASNRYISESKFIVRSVEKSGLASSVGFLEALGIRRTNDDAYAIEGYIQSRDLMLAVASRVDLRDIYRAEGADPITRYSASGTDDTNEALYRYFKRQIEVNHDIETGITTVRVSAYRARDASTIANLILKFSEIQVNALNNRAQRDAVSAAKDSMSDATRDLIEVNANLTRYRNLTQTVNPGISASDATTRTGDLGQQRALLALELQETRTKAPSNPAINAMTRRLAALDAEVAREKGQLAGDKDALATKLGTFEELTVRRELSEKAYEAAAKRLEAAYREASQQQTYIELIAKPNLPDAPAEPRRLRYISTVALFAFWAFLMVYLLYSGGREHLNLH